MGLKPDDRVIRSDGIHNFRDYGGYGTQDGRRIAWRRLYRSSQHLEASDDDLKRLNVMNIDQVIDLRGCKERERFPCRRHPDFSAQILYAKGETVNSTHDDLSSAMGKEDVWRLMRDSYTNLPFLPRLQVAFQFFFKALATAQQASLVHCLAGKDRTGLAVALFHELMGVHRDDIMKDFLLTNEVGDVEKRIEAGARTIRSFYGEYVPDDIIRTLMGVDAGWLDAAFASIEAEYGDVRSYAAEILDINEERRNRLADIYLL